MNLRFVAACSPRLSRLTVANAVPSILMATTIRASPGPTMSAGDLDPVLTSSSSWSISDSSTMSSLPELGDEEPVVLAMATLRYHARTERY